MVSIHFIAYLERLIRELENSKKPHQSPWAQIVLSNHLAGFWPWMNPQGPGEAVLMTSGSRAQVGAVLCVACPLRYKGQRSCGFCPHTASNSDGKTIRPAEAVVSAPQVAFGFPRQENPKTIKNQRNQNNTHRAYVSEMLITLSNLQIILTLDTRPANSCMTGILFVFENEVIAPHPRPHHTHPEEKIERKAQSGRSRPLSIALGCTLPILGVC